MDWKRIVSPFILIISKLLFGFVSAIVWLNGGKSAKWIERKIMIGEFVLSLTSETRGRGLMLTCYDTAANYEYVSIDGQGSKIIVNTQNEDSYTIKGTIYSARSDRYFYKVFRDEELIDEGSLIPQGAGVYYEQDKGFTFTISRDLVVGEYRLVIYSNVEANTPCGIGSFEFIVN